MVQGTHSNCIFKFSMFSLCFPVQSQIFPVPVKFSRQILQYPLPLESGNLQFEQTKFPVFSMCFGKISKFLVFSLGHFPCFPCAVGTLRYFSNLLTNRATVSNHQSGLMALSHTVYNSIAPDSYPRQDSVSCTAEGLYLQATLKKGVCPVQQ